MPDVTVNLSCGHFIDCDIDTLMNTETFLCWACTKFRQGGRDAYVGWVTFQAYTTGYSFRCTQCRYSRAYGEAEHMCKTAGEKHSRSKTHVVVFSHNGKEVSRTKHLTQPTLF